jgi:DNA-binding NtrC family response regulator
MKTILVLEAEVAVMTLLRTTLKRPYRLIEAITAEEALQLFIEHDPRCGIDLFITEVILPTCSGIQVALLLRTRRADLPVVLTCGYPTSDWNCQDSADLVRLGTNSMALLEEPFSAPALSSVVQQLIGSIKSESARTARSSP